MPDLYFNGKFLSAPPSGVHRVAEEIIRAVDARLAEGDEPARAAILHPPGIRRELPLKVIPHRRAGRSAGPVWEQTELARAARGGLLINLCNLGPVSARNAVTMIHDAQVRDAPESYSAAFRAYYNAVQPVLGRRHRLILTVSNYARMRLMVHRTAPAEAIRVVHNGVDHVSRVAPDRNAVHTCGLSPGGYVMALANAQPHKNIAVLTEAFRDPRLSDLTLVLFGDDPVHAIDANAPKNVISAGRVSDAALYGLMSNALAYACPSLTEGFGLPPLEAMALGAPVIAAPRGAMPEVLGEAAIWADPEDPAAWAGEILRLRADGAKRAERSSAGRARASRYRWADAADRIVNLTREAAPLRIPA